MTFSILERLLDGSGIVRCVFDLRDAGRAVQHLGYRFAALLDGIGNNRVVRMSVTVRVIGMQGARDDAAVGKRYANGLADERLDFLIGHGVLSPLYLRIDVARMRVVQGTA